MGNYLKAMVGVPVIALKYIFLLTDRGKDISVKNFPV